MMDVEKQVIAIQGLAKQADPALWMRLRKMQRLYEKEENVVIKERRKTGNLRVLQPIAADVQKELEHYRERVGKLERQLELSNAQSAGRGARRERGVQTDPVPDAPAGAEELAAMRREVLMMRGESRDVAERKELAKADSEKRLSDLRNAAWQKPRRLRVPGPRHDILLPPIPILVTKGSTGPTEFSQTSSGFH